MMQKPPKHLAALKFYSTDGIRAYKAHYRKAQATKPSLKALKPKP